MPCVIGLMSGTSLDGVDAVRVRISGERWDLRVEVLEGITYPYPEKLRSSLLDLCGGALVSVAELAALDDQVAIVFAEAALAVQAAVQDEQHWATLIGSHGQTIYHRPPHPLDPPSLVPPLPLGYSWQLGRGSVIAHHTQLPTVCNFRAADLAAGGQGAPLVPGVDLYWFTHPQEYRCVQNLGGIGNVTVLPPHQPQPGFTDLPRVLGWDTGPGNSLLDLAVQELSQGRYTYDRGGTWAAQGKPHPALVEQWLRHPFFHQWPPKSTGRELFGLDYWRRCQREAQAQGVVAADLLASLTELTARSIAHSYTQFLPQAPDRVLVCGGGVHNDYLLARLAHHLHPVRVETTGCQGVDPDFKEAMAFAVLAHWHRLGIPGNLPAVTGARGAKILGDYHDPN